MGKYTISTGPFSIANLVCLPEGVYTIFLRGYLYRTPQVCPKDGVYHHGVPPAILRGPFAAACPNPCISCVWDSSMKKLDEEASVLIYTYCDIYIYVCMCMFTFTFMFMYMYMYMYMCMYMYICVYIYIHIYIIIYICMYIYIYVYIWWVLRLHV